MGNADRIEQLRARASALHNAGQWAEAEQVYRRILELHRSDLSARHMIGLLRLQQGRAVDNIIFMLKKRFVHALRALSLIRQTDILCLLGALAGGLSL